MAVTKRKVTITIDCDLYNSAKSKYDNLSGRVNELLSMDLYGSDEKAELVDRLHELKLEEKSITRRICELEKEEVIIRESRANVDNVLNWAIEVYSHKGVIGLNQIEAACRRHECDFNEVVRILESEDIAMVKFA